MKRFLLTIATLALLAAPAQAGMKYPNWFAFEMILAEHGAAPYRPYLQCNYTARICLKGFALVDSYFGRGSIDFVGVVLDGNDRTTELKHIRCLGSFDRCADYDVGLAPGGRLVTMPDMPAACVELLRTTGEFDRGEGDGPCKGYSVAFNYLEDLKKGK